MKPELLDVGTTSAALDRRRERATKVDARLEEIFRKAGNDPLLEELRKLVRDHLLERE